jgi:hypothetical protein
MHVTIFSNSNAISSTLQSAEMFKIKFKFVEVSEMQKTFPVAIACEPHLI